MKTLTKKRRFLAALTAALLISAALVASCMNLLEEQDGKIVIPEGKGVIRLNFVKTNRTIFPDVLEDPADLFYVIEFKLGAGSPTRYPTSGTVNGTDVLDPIPLDAGTYNITITAYDAPGGTVGTEVAGWTGNNVIITTSVSTPITVNLQGWTSGGTGSFQYSITVPAAPSFTTFTTGAYVWQPSAYTAKLEIKNSSGNIISDDSINPITLTPGATNTQASLSIVNPATLPAGYYTVKITLSAVNCQDRVMEESLHIYNGNTSKYTVNVPAINQNKFAVLFDLNGHDSDDPESTFNRDCTSDIPAGLDYSNTQFQTSIENAGTLDFPGTPKTTETDVGAPLGYDFIGWFTDASIGTEWDFGNKIFKDTHLYARWRPITAPGGEGPEFSFTYDVTDASITAAPTNPATFTYDDIAGGTKSLTFTLDSSFTVIAWTIDGVSITGSGNSVTIDESTAPAALNQFLVKGTHVLTVKASKGGQPFTKYVTFTVN